MKIVKRELRIERLGFVSVIARKLIAIRMASHDECSFSDLPCSTPSPLTLELMTISSLHTVRFQTSSQTPAQVHLAIIPITHTLATHPLHSSTQSHLNINNVFRRPTTRQEQTRRRRSKSHRHEKRRENRHTTVGSPCHNVMSIPWLNASLLHATPIHATPLDKNS